LEDGNAFKVGGWFLRGIIRLPSWDVHAALSRRILGISEAVSKEINKLVDGEDVHDLGRRMPREPKLLEKLLTPELAAECAARLARAETRLYSILSRGARLC